MKLKIVYFGSPSFSATFLEKIINDKNLPVEVKLVVTQPDMPVGRKQILTPTPVKLIAEKYRLPVIYSTEFKVGNDQLSMTNYQTIINNSMINKKSTKIEKLKIDYSLNIEHLNIDHLDLCLVYAYGEILSKEILSLPKFGFWNIHPSLLPKYRGASPIAYPLIMGDKKTGVSLMLMDEKMDHGPILAQEELEIKPDDMRPDLEIKLTNLAYDMFKQLISTNFNKFQQISTKIQDHSYATYTSILKKSDGFIPFSILKRMLQNENIIAKELPEFMQRYYSKYSIINNQYKKPIENWKLKIENSSKLLFNLFRGLSPWPGLWTLIKVGNVEKRLKITDVEIIDNKLQIKKVQLEGKKEVDFNTFNKAYRIFL